MEFEVVGTAPDKAYLLLVHGLLSSRNHWMLNRDRLAKHYNLVLVDLPAHGSSAAPEPDRHWHPDAMVGALDAIRENLGLDQWFICGQSFGAGLTLRYSLQLPERVIAQAFTNARTAFRDNTDPSEIAARAARVAVLREGGMAALRKERFHPRFAKRFPADIRERLCADAERIDLEGYMRILETSLPSASIKDSVAETKVPTLLINGRHERIFQPIREQLVTDWPTLEIVDIDGGHSVNIENAAQFDQYLLAFFQRFDRGLTS